jgi:hypothetical protein
MIFSYVALSGRLNQKLQGKIMVKRKFHLYKIRFVETITRRFLKIRLKYYYIFCYSVSCNRNCRNTFCRAWMSIGFAK